MLWAMGQTGHHQVDCSRVVGRQSPTVTHRDGRTSRRLEVDERRRPRCLVGRYCNWSDRYWGVYCHEELRRRWPHCRTTTKVNGKDKTWPGRTTHRTAGTPFKSYFLSNVYRISCAVSDFCSFSFFFPLWFRVAVFGRYINFYSPTIVIVRKHSNTHTKQNQN